MKLSKLNRAFHRWGSILALLPLMIIIVSGIAKRRRGRNKPDASKDDQHPVPKPEPRMDPG